jgi:hypothetical protein
MLVLFILFSITAYNQSKDRSSIALGVEKEYLTYKKFFVFKPNKTLKILTLDKIKYTSDNYSFSDKFIVMNRKDTVLFENISWIKGRVYGDKGRKIAGIIITSFTALYGPGTIIFVGLEAGGGPAIIAAILVAGTIYSGIAIMGPRKFRRTQDCYVKVIKKMTP